MSNVLIEIRENAAIVTHGNGGDSLFKKTVKIESLVKAFQDKGTGINTPVLPVGTIKWQEKGNRAFLFLYSPPVKFDANYKSEVITDCIRPGVIMKFELQVNKKNFTLSQTFAWAVKDAPMFFNDNTILYNLPFPNVSDSGWVCWGGGSVLSGEFQSLCGLGNYINRLFNAPFNNDLFQGSLFRHVGFDTPLGLFNFLKGKEEFPDQLYVDSGRNYTLGTI